MTLQKQNHAGFKADNILLGHDISPLLNELR